MKMPDLPSEALVEASRADHIAGALVSRIISTTIDKVVLESGLASETVGERCPIPSSPPTSHEGMKKDHSGTCAVSGEANSAAPYGANEQLPPAPYSWPRRRQRSHSDEHNTARAVDRSQEDECRVESHAGRKRLSNEKVKIVGPIPKDHSPTEGNEAEPLWPSFDLGAPESTSTGRPEVDLFQMNYPRRRDVITVCSGSGATLEFLGSSTPEDGCRGCVGDTVGRAPSVHISLWFQASVPGSQTVLGSYSLLITAHSFLWCVIRRLLGALAGPRGV